MVGGATIVTSQSRSDRYVSGRACNHDCRSWAGARVGVMSYPRRLKSAAMALGPIGRLVRDRDRWRRRAEESGWNVRAEWAGLAGDRVPIGSYLTLSKQPPIPMPPEKLRFMDVSEADFIWTADSLIQQLVDYARLKPDHSILDVGCGYGRLAHALLRHGHRGRYVGFDVIEPHIAWCNTELVPASDSRYAQRPLQPRGAYRCHGCHF